MVIADTETFFDLAVRVQFRSTSECITIRVPVNALGRDVADVLSQRYGCRVDAIVARTGRRLDPECAVAELDVVWGDELRLVDAESTTQPSSRSLGHGAGCLVLSVVGGPSEGLQIPVGEAVTVGRENIAGVQGIHGETTSRLHAEIVPSLLGGQISDLGSKNGTWVNGVRIDRPSMLHAGDRVVIGPNVAVVELDSLPQRHFEHPHLSARQGRLAFNRPPRVHEPAPPQTVVVPAAPDRPASRRFPIGAAVAPLILGIALAILWNPLFALFIALSPIMLAFSFIDDRRSGRRTFRDELAAFDTSIEGIARTVRHRTEQVASHRRKQAPEDRQLLWWSHVAAPEVWSRRPDDDDFSIVALGDRMTSEMLAIEYSSDGDAEARARAAEMIGQSQPTVRTPVSVDLRMTGVVGFCGDRGASRSTVRSVIAQLATLRSPRDLNVVVLAESSDQHWNWAKWLPHTNHSIASTSDQISAAFTKVEEMAHTRREHLETSLGVPLVLPHVALVIDGELPVSPRALSRLLEDAHAVGISVWIVGQHRYDLPGEVAVVVECNSGERGNAELSVTFAGTGERFDGVVARRLRVGRAERIARNLAPLIDETQARAGGDLPAVFTLHDALRTGDARLLINESSPTIETFAARIAAEWKTSGSGLQAIIGAGEGDVFQLDLRRDGPHALVAGTTGAGKSEFLQTLVTSLALTYSPKRLNFILIDYKGGAAFSRCNDLPHTVGSVTNLDERLAERALISLRAELRRRERILAEHDAKDLVTLEEQNPEAAPPSLVLVIDEFAALRNEVPEFVDGIVDIAQRGRSMGVHLVLATQKPAGVITAQIEANTNIRVALRVANDAESRDVLGTVAAAAIDRAHPGRAIVRIGTDDGVSVQTAWVGRRCVDEGVEPASIRPLGAPANTTAHAIDAEAPTELDELVMAINLAAEGSEMPTPHRPWIEELPDFVSAEEIASEAPRHPAEIPVGLADYPDVQRQDAWMLDLSTFGNAAVFGAAGSGKTTLLRTAVAQVARTFGPDEAVVYALDATAGGMRCIEAIPNVAAVVDGNDPAQAQLLFDVLGREAAARRNQLVQLGLENHAQWRQLGAGAENRASSAIPAPPVMVVCIDGFDAVWSAIEGLDGGRVGVEISDLFAGGQALGIYVLWTARQRGLIPGAVMSTAGLQLVQRMTSADDYGWFGLKPGDREIVAGRTFLASASGELEFQVATVGQGSTADIEALGPRLVDQRGALRPKGLPEWPDLLTTDDLGRPSTCSRSAVIAGVDAFGDPVSLDFTRNATALVVGPAQSGRSSVLGGIVEGLESITDDRILISPRRGSVLRDMDGWLEVITHDCASALEQLVAYVEERRSQESDTVLVVVIDDADDLLEGLEADALASLVRIATDANVVVLAAATTFLIGSSYSPWVRMMRNMGLGIVLQPSSREDTEVFNAPFPRRGVGPAAPGRGVLIDRQQITQTHFARCGSVQE